MGSLGPVPGTSEVPCGCHVSKTISTVVETVVTPGQAGCEGDLKEVTTLVKNEAVRLSHAYRAPFPKDKRKGGLPFSVFYVPDIGAGTSRTSPIKLIIAPQGRSL